MTQAGNSGPAYATVSGPAGAFDFASLSTNNIVPLSAAAYNTGGAGTWATTDVVKVTGSQALTAATSVTAMLLSGDNITVSGAFGLTLSAGALLDSDTSGITGNSIASSVTGLDA